jgi:hypothetical protein
LPTEQTTLGIDFFFPDLGAEQRLLAAPASEPVCAMLKPILIGSPLLCAKANVLARAGEIRAAPMPALTRRRVIRRIMCSSKNILFLSAL